MTVLDGIGERVARGGPLTDADARAILETPDLIAVGGLADDVRRRMHGARTTFVRVFEVHAVAPPAALPPRVSAGELRIVGTPAAIDAAVAAVRAASTLAGSVPVTGFSLPDLQMLAAAARRSLEAVCRDLRSAGLYGIAEVPLDTLASPEAIEVARNTGLAVPRLTVHAIADDMRIAIVSRARDLQRAVGGFLALAPLPRTVPVAQPTTGYDDVKLIALARLLADNIASIQVDWALYGPKLAQVGLIVGADDVDGVAAVDPGALGTRRSPIEEIKGNIRAAGLEAVERNARFEIVGEPGGQGG
jgi:aminodeoxyfutalosine synthase